MSNSNQHPKGQIDSFDNLPAFTSEEEEAEFWETHELGPALLAQMEPPEEGELPAVRSRTTPISLRMDTGVLVELKSEATQRDTGYQTFMKQLVVYGLAMLRRDSALRAGSPTPVDGGLSAQDRPSIRRHTAVVRQRGHVYDYAE